jgi:hypothetical protein
MPDDTHTFASATSRSLNQQRVAESAHLLAQYRGIAGWLFQRRNYRDAEFRYCLSRKDFVADRGERLGRWSNENETGIAHAPGKSRIL